ncbi:hypothetical protein GIB67_000308 [Kingdonia uniflora]|uniref:Uncharacterized protein n=1 Tax=Kingdonia uniflora TaxID=39325 RepID=A0A7J7LCK1_9MAGN|nr:hypothetical protein GIB67_000308 [Kingdonia uniflora]
MGLVLKFFQWRILHAQGIVRFLFLWEFLVGYHVCENGVCGFEVWGNTYPLSLRRSSIITVVYFLFMIVLNGDVIAALLFIYWTIVRFFFVGVFSWIAHLKMGFVLKFFQWRILHAQGFLI